MTKSQRGLRAVILAAAASLLMLFVPSDAAGKVNEYGKIPSAYSSTADYPFALFFRDGTGYTFLMRRQRVL